MKKLTPFIILLLLLPFIYAQDYSQYEKLDIQLDITSDIEIIPTASDYKVDYVKTKLSFYPREDFQQQIISIETTPEAKQTSELMIFEWEKPEEKKLSFSLNSKLQTKNTINKIPKKVRFPIEDIPNHYIEFTQPSEKIDSDNQDIINLASELAEGEDDLYQVVFNLAEYTKDNIEYDLSTLTAEASQSSSWVLKNKYGVCDELTNLFIGLARSLNIPAKFISGVAYTNSPLFPDNWGAHGWAEIYFPEYGWVPFDVTYGQYGFIDITHIKLQEALDSDESSTDYEWKSHNTELDTKKLDINTEVIKTQGIAESPIGLTAKIIKPQTDIGSYNLVEATAKNLRQYYVTTELHLSNVAELTILDDKPKPILLKPEETKKAYWIVNLKKDLNQDYIYTIPISVYTTRNITSKTEFTASKNQPTYTRQDIEQIMDEKIEEKEKVYSSNIEFRCALEKEQYYLHEEMLAACSVKNTGNTIVDSLNICMKEKCRTLSLPIAQEKSTNFLIDEIEPGKKEILITAKNNQISKSSSITFTALDRPKLSILDITYPESVRYKDIYNVSFLLKKESFSNPKNILIQLQRKHYKKEWHINQLDSDKDFTLMLQGSSLTTNENNFKISITYNDDNDQYKEEETFTILLEKPTFFQRLMIYFNNIGNAVKNIFQ